jgi:hypothetical protein
MSNLIEVLAENLKAGQTLGNGKRIAAVDAQCPRDIRITFDDGSYIFVKWDVEMLVIA